MTKAEEASAYRAYSEMLRQLIHGEIPQGEETAAKLEALRLKWLNGRNPEDIQHYNPIPRKKANGD